MSKRGMGLMVAGGFALLLLGGKKKRKSSGKDLSDRDGDGYHDGDGLLDPDGKKTDGSSGKKSGTGKKSDGSYNVPDLAPDAIWVSPDCQRVFFADGRIGEPNVGSLWFSEKAVPAIDRFISANYDDPYEIARQMILSMAPCAAEFPVRSDGVSQFELQAGRDYFLNTYRDVYTLIMLLVESAQSALNQDGEMISFNSNCDVTFVGNQWEKYVAKPMVDFYIGQQLESGTPDSTTELINSVVPKVIGRFSPPCGQRMSSLASDSARIKFSSARPGLSSVIQTIGYLVSESFMEFSPP